MSQQPNAHGQSQTPSQTPGPASASAGASAAVPTQSQTPTPGPPQQQQRQMGAQQQRPASQNGTQLDLSQLQPAQVQILLNQMNNCQKEAQRLGDTPAGKEQFFKYQRIKMLLQQYHQIKQSQAGGSASPNLQANRQLTPQQQQQQQQQQQKSQSPQLQQQQKTQMQLQQAKMQQAQQVQPGQAAQDQQTPQRNIQIQPNQQQANLMRNQTSSPSPGVAPNKPVGGGPASNAGTPQSSQTPKLTALQQYRQLQGVLPEFVKRLEKIEISKKSGNLPPDQLAKLIEQENTVRTRYNSYKKVMNTLEQQLKEQHNNRGSPQITPAGTPFQQPSSQSQGSQQYPQVQQPQAQQQQQQQQQIQNQMQQNSIQMQNQSRPPSAQQGAQPQAQVQAQRAMMYQKQMAAKGNNGNNLPQNQMPPQQQLTPQQTPQQSQQQLTPAQRKQQQQQQQQPRTGTPQIPEQNTQSQTQAPTPAPATQTPGVMNNRGSAGAKSQSPSTPITNVNAAARPTSNNMANGGPISTSNTTVFKSSIPSAAVSQTVTAKPPVPVAPPASNASLSGGSAISAPSLTTPALLKLPPYEMQGDRVLAKRKLSELVKTVGADEGDGETVIDGDVEELLLDLADEFVTNVTSFACRLAKHRKSENLQSKDVQLHLEKNYNIRIPGYASDDIRSVRKWVSNGQHATRVQGIEISKSVEQNK